MNVPIWNGSSSFYPGMTPFGFYDYDYQFQQDADRVAMFCSRRLGYPIVEVELQDINFYAAFEEAITTYGNELYAYKVRENYLSLEGLPTSSNLNNQLVVPTLSRIIAISQQYGAEAGSGGNIPYYDALITLTASVQDYDLNAWAEEEEIDGTIEIKRVFYQAPPAMVRFFDPYAGTGTDLAGFLDAFGFGNYSPAINFMMMPISYDVLKIQAIEFNDTIRKSNYSFEVANNVLKIFPIPDRDGDTIKIQYIIKKERDEAALVSGSAGLVTNVSNVPYTNPIYTQINSIGRSWVFEYTLALCKEILGYVRGKYTTIPIPNSDVTLNHSDLITAASEEKKALIERLRAYFDETSREKLLESRKLQTEYMQDELKQVPFTIYIG
jgi:hypothetical protein